MAEKKKEGATSVYAQLKPRDESYTERIAREAREKEAKAKVAAEKKREQQAGRLGGVRTIYGSGQLANKTPK